VGLRKIQAALVSIILVFVLIRLAWWSVEPLVRPVGTALLVVLVLAMVYRWLFRG
jgi:hypothetical protein